VHNRELIAIIRKMSTDKTDLEYLPDFSLMACLEIERLTAELEKATQND
jgi:hypothetical protein